MPCRVALQTSEGSSFHAHWIIMTCQRNNSRPDDNAKNCPPSSSPGAPCIFQQRKAVPWALGSGHLKHQIIFLTLWLACLMKNENSQWENASSISWYLCNPPGSHTTSIPPSQGCLWKWTINKCHPLFPTIKISLGRRHFQQHPQPLSHLQHTAWSLWEDVHCKELSRTWGFWDVPVTPGALAKTAPEKPIWRACWASEWWKIKSQNVSESCLMDCNFATLVTMEKSCPETTARSFSSWVGDATRSLPFLYSCQTSWKQALIVTCDG